MSWMAKLYETYEEAMVLDLSSEEPMMPISHTLQNTHINIVIDGDGNFKRAAVLEKTQIVLPATEKSAGRSSGEAPHPLADKIQYIAKDYASHGGLKKPYFAGYKQQLSSWCNSSYAHEKAVAVYRYINQGCVVHDLVSANVLYVDDNRKLLADWPHKTDKDNPAPLIFKVLPVLTKEKRKQKDRPEIEQGSALVCWTVETPGDKSSKTWLDQSLQQSWIAFDAMREGEKGLCLISALKQQTLASSHPAKLRHTGDKAKLVSANDKSGFTFRGRFTDNNGRQASGVSFEVTQKSHNALRYLISRQGYRNDDQVYIAWAVSGKTIPEPLKSSWAMLTDDISRQPEIGPGSVEPQDQIDHGVDFGESFAHKFNNYLRGYRAKLEPNEQIVIMGLDSATPGRMGIIYYRELLASEFLDRIHDWHIQFAWPQRHTKEYPNPKNKKKSIRKTIWPVSTPIPRVIAEAAYGDILTSNKTLKKSLLERILPCIVDGRPFPQDVMLAAVRRASNRSAYKTDKKWEWERNLGVACALFKGFYIRHPDKTKRRKYAMTLEEDRKTRDYLYGRLLAIAERIEEVALNVGGESRPTTAARLMQRFADRPFSTWRNIELGLQPYMQRLQGKRAGFLTNRKKELDVVHAAFSPPDDFTNDKPLSGEFLLGYHCQRQDWLNKKETNNETNNEN